MEKKFKRSFDEIRNIVSMTVDFFAQENLDNSLRNGVDLATEELFVNMVTYTFAQLPFPFSEWIRRMQFENANGRNPKDRLLSGSASRMSTMSE